jgi:hypothetical protein
MSFSRTEDSARFDNIRSALLIGVVIQGGRRLPRGFQRFGHETNRITMRENLDDVESALGGDGVVNT